MRLLSFLAELMRVLIILFLGIYILGKIELHIFEGFKLESNFWMIFIGNIILVFILYRNRFQFSGWYKYGNKKLSTRVTWVLVFIAASLLAGSLFL